MGQNKGRGDFNGVYFKEGVHVSDFAYACLKFTESTALKENA